MACLDSVRIFLLCLTCLADFAAFTGPAGAQDVRFEQRLDGISRTQIFEGGRGLSLDPMQRQDFRFGPEVLEDEVGMSRPFIDAPGRITKFPWLKPEMEVKLNAFGIGKERLTDLIGVGNGLEMVPFRVVEPDDAVDEILAQIQDLPEPEKFRIVGALDETDAATQRRKCTVAVKDLTRQRVEWTGRTLLTDFSSLCFGEDPAVWLNGTVTEQQNSATQTCALAYERYRQDCLGQGSVATVEQEPFVGVLVRRVGAAAPRQIICTVTFVGNDVAVTAAHCAQDLRVEGANVQLSVFSRSPAIVERPVVAVAQGPGYDLLSVADLVTHSGPSNKQDDIAFVFFKGAPQGANTPQSTILFPLFSQGATYHPAALVGFQPLAKREFVLDWLQDSATFLDDEALLESGAWEKFVLKESTAHCIPIKPVAADAGPREIGHQCQSFSGTSGAPIFNIRDGRATFEIGALHTLAAELESSNAIQAINEGVLIPSDLADTKVRLEQEFVERFEN
ncbi:hypothetical protein GOD96_29320 [Sinorhizobium medicae]|nr:hypothetical protein [Sinorhizobium medicae]